MMNDVSTKEKLLEANRALGWELPYEEDLSPLAEPLVVGNRTIANRIAYQPMEGCDGTADGRPDELTMRRYRRFAEGGPGVIWFEAIAVQEDGRANPRQLWLTEKNMDAYAAAVEEIKEICLKKNGFEPVIFAQLTHSGRYSKPYVPGRPDPLIAYNNPLFEKENPIPAERIVTDEYLDRLGENLVLAAERAEKIGFDGADIKACHRYLNSELLSAYNRPGRYGGCFENRTRLFREAVQGAIQRTSGDFLVSSRMNAYDAFPYPYGFGVKEGCGIEPDWTEAIRLIGDLKKCGVKILNITMGNPYVNPHVNRPYNAGGYIPPEEPFTGVARMLTGIRTLQQAHPDLPLISSGLTWLSNSSANVAAGCVKDGWFAMAGYGRMTLAHPNLANEILKDGKLEKKHCCIMCSKCTEIMRTVNGTPGCVIRDPEVYMPIYRQQCGKK